MPMVAQHGAMGKRIGARTGRSDTKKDRVIADAVLMSLVEPHWEGRCACRDRGRTVSARP